MTRSEIEFVFSGFGGQGVLFAGQLLAHAAMGANKHVTWIPSYGPEMRGGTANCTVVVSDSSIGAPLVRHPGVAIVFNLPSFDKYEPLIRSGGLLVANSTLVDRTSIRPDLTVIAVPGTKLAEGLGDVRLVNMILLGAAVTARPVIPLESLNRALEERLSEQKTDLLSLNYLALARGAKLAKDSF